MLQLMPVTKVEICKLSNFVRDVYFAFKIKFYGLEFPKSTLEERKKIIEKVIICNH